MRKNYSVEPVMLLSGDRKVRTDFSDETLEPGNTIIVHGLWKKIRELNDQKTFVLATPVEAAPAAGSRPVLALLCFLAAIVLALSGVHLSLGLMTGAIGMIVLRVVPIDEAYRAVDWRTVFLLAGLIPLGIAMEHTGAAAYIADRMMTILEGAHPLIIMTAVAVLATIFSLFMSNVAATVLLVPLVIPGHLAKTGSQHVKPFARLPIEHRQVPLLRSHGVPSARITDQPVATGLLDRNCRVW